MIVYQLFFRNADSSAHFYGKALDIKFNYDISRSLPYMQVFFLIFSFGFISAKDLVGIEDQFWKVCLYIFIMGFYPLMVAISWFDLVFLWWWYAFVDIPDFIKNLDALNSGLVPLVSDVSSDWLKSQKDYVEWVCSTRAAKFMKPYNIEGTELSNKCVKIYKENNKN